MLLSTLPLTNLNPRSISLGWLPQDSSCKCNPKIYSVLCDSLLLLRIMLGVAVNFSHIPPPCHKPLAFSSIKVHCHVYSFMLISHQ